MYYTGQPMKRVEDPHLVSGQGSFVDDVQLPDMLHAVILRSPHAHARIRAVDVTAARGMPGVVAVLTGADIAGVLGDVPTRAMVGGWERAQTPCADAVAPVASAPFTPEKIWRALHGATGDRHDATTAAR